MRRRHEGGDEDWGKGKQKGEKGKQKKRSEEGIKGTGREESRMEGKNVEQAEEWGGGNVKTKDRREGIKGAEEAHTQKKRRGSRV